MLLAGSGMVEYSRLTPEVRDQLLQVIDEVAPRFDRVLLDTGAGISDVVLYTVSLADEVLVVATPEPTSMTDAYATIKVLATHAEAGATIRLVVNQIARAGEGRDDPQPAAAGGRPLRHPAARGRAAPVPLLDLLGEVPADPAVREAVQRRQLLLETLAGLRRRRMAVAAGDADAA